MKQLLDLLFLFTIQNVASSYTLFSSKLLDQVNIFKMQDKNLVFIKTLDVQF